MTTVEVYMRGELMSYSEETLKSFLNMAEGRRAEGRNMVAMIYDNTARQYGYASLDEAEKLLKRGTGRNAGHDQKQALYPLGMRSSCNIRMYDVGDGLLSS